MAPVSVDDLSLMQLHELSLLAQQQPAGVTPMAEAMPSARPAALWAPRPLSQLVSQLNPTSALVTTDSVQKLSVCNVGLALQQEERNPGNACAPCASPRVKVGGKPHHNDRAMQQPQAGSRSSTAAHPLLSATASHDHTHHTTCVVASSALQTSPQRARPQRQGPSLALPVQAQASAGNATTLRSSQRSALQPATSAAVLPQQHASEQTSGSSRRSGSGSADQDLDPVERLRRLQQLMAPSPREEEKEQEAIAAAAAARKVVSAGGSSAVIPWPAADAQQPLIWPLQQQQQRLQPIQPSGMAASRGVPGPADERVAPLAASSAPRPPSKPRRVSADQPLLLPTARAEAASAAAARSHAAANAPAPPQPQLPVTRMPRRASDPQVSATAQPAVAEARAPRRSYGQGHGLLQPDDVMSIGVVAQGLRRNASLERSQQALAPVPEQQLSARLSVSGASRSGSSACGSLASTGGSSTGSGSGSGSSRRHSVELPPLVPANAALEAASLTSAAAGPQAQCAAASASVPPRAPRSGQRPAGVHHGRSISSEVLSAAASEAQAASLKGAAASQAPAAPSLKLGHVATAAAPEPVTAAAAQKPATRQRVCSGGSTSAAASGLPAIGCSAVAAPSSSAAHEARAAPPGSERRRTHDQTYKSPGRSSRGQKRQ